MVQNPLKAQAALQVLVHPPPPLLFSLKPVLRCTSLASQLGSKAKPPQLTTCASPYRSFTPASRRRNTNGSFPHGRRGPVQDPAHGHHGRRTARLLQGGRGDAGAEDALHGAHEAVFAVRQDDEEVDACGSVRRAERSLFK